MTTPTVLCIGQSDSCAGTGIQADLKTAQGYGVHAATIVTVITVQNTKGIRASHIMPPMLVYDQIEAVVEDLKPSVIKLGVLGNEPIINMIGDYLDHIPQTDRPKIVVDPEMSRTGTALLDKPARDALKRRLLIHADVLVPNLQEAYELSGIEINDLDDMKHAAVTLRTLGVEHVIIKGTKLVQDKIFDVYATGSGEPEVFEYERIETQALYGAGATLTTALACEMLEQKDVRQAYTNARRYVMDAMSHAYDLGGGFKPVCQRPVSMIKA